MRAATILMEATGPGQGGEEDESEAQMNTMPSSTQSEFVTASLLVKPSAEAPTVRPANLKNDRLLDNRSWLGKLAPLAFAHYLIALLIGVAATLAWQTYGDAAKHMIASAASSLDQQQFNAMSLDLDAMRQSVDGLTTSIDALTTRIATNQEQIMRSVDRLTAGQEQTTREIAKLQAVEQYVLYKDPDPSPRPAPTLVPKPALRPSQAPTAVTPAKNP